MCILAPPPPNVPHASAAQALTVDSMVLCSEAKVSCFSKGSQSLCSFGVSGTYYMR